MLLGGIKRIVQATQAFRYSRFLILILFFLVQLLIINQIISTQLYFYLEYILPGKNNI